MPGSSSTRVSWAQRIGRSTQLGAAARGGGAYPGTSSARATIAPAMLNVFRNALRERSSCMVGEASRDRSRYPATAGPMASEADDHGRPSLCHGTLMMISSPSDCNESTVRRKPVPHLGWASIPARARGYGDVARAKNQGRALARLGEIALMIRLPWTPSHRRQLGVRGVGSYSMIA